MSDRCILILFASQTGNAKEVADAIGREARKRAFDPTIRSMDEFDVRDLPAQSIVAFVVATAGQGDPPDSMRSFWKFLLRKDLPADSLSRVRFAVFGLGDSSYEKYNFMGKKLFRRILNLGGRKIIARGDGDDQHPQGFYGAFDVWNDALWSVLAPEHAMDKCIEDEECPKPKFTLTLVPHNSTDAHPKSSTTTSSSSSLGPPKTSSGPPYDHRNAFSARVMVNRCITDPSWDNPVHHMEFQLDSEQSGITYSPGSVIHILPCNSLDTTERFLRRCELLDVAHHIITCIRPTHACDEPPRGIDTPLSLHRLVSKHLDVEYTPRRYFFELLAHFATEEAEKKRLRQLSRPENLDDLLEYCTRERRSILEVLEDFPSVRPPIDYLLDLVPLIRARPFSISSAYDAHPSTAHVTLAHVKYHTPMGRPRRGLCSSFLTKIDPMDESNNHVDLWITKGYTTLPSDSSVPIIMVGPGTGLAMFRSFLQHRRWQKEQKGIDVGECAFFFGCRHAAMDYLYKEEWEEYQSIGILSHYSVAFSRDQPEKVYVQHKLRECSAMIARWLMEKGAHFYISGNARGMPDAVRDAVIFSLHTHGDMSMDEAEIAVKSLKSNGRWHTETWY